jgi:hypothetical protein
MKNIAFVLNSIGRYDRKVIPYAAAVALFDVAVPFAGIFLPRLILSLLVASRGVHADARSALLHERILRATVGGGRSSLRLAGQMT